MLEQTRCRRRCRRLLVTVFIFRAAAGVFERPLLCWAFLHASSDSGPLCRRPNVYSVRCSAGCCCRAVCSFRDLYVHVRAPE